MLLHLFIIHLSQPFCCSFFVRDCLNFCYRGEGERLFVFEAPIDLLSFLCLFKKEWQKQSYLALGGVGEKALLRFLSDRPNIKTVFLCLDSDEAGNDACSRLAELMPECLTVHRLVPLYKDWNEVQTRRGEITDGKYLREAVYGLKEPPQVETVEIIRMSEVDTQAVEWLWEPYIPFGKVTIVQGNPGEGKTTVKCSKIVYRLCNHMVYSFDILKASQKKRKRWRWLGRKGLWK